MKISELPFDILHHIFTHLDVLSVYCLASAVSSIQPPIIPLSSLLPRETLDNTAAYVLVLIIWLRNITEIEPLQQIRDHQTQRLSIKVMTPPIAGDSVLTRKPSEKHINGLQQWFSELYPVDSMVQQFRQIDSVLDDAVAARAFENRNKEDLVFALLLLQHHIIYDDQEPQEPLANDAKVILNEVIIPAWYFLFLSEGRSSSTFSKCVARASPWMPLDDKEYNDLLFDMRTWRANRSIPPDERNTQSARLQSKSTYRRQLLIKNILHSGNQQEVWDMICSSAPRLGALLPSNHRAPSLSKKEKIVLGSIDWGIQKLVQFPIQLAQMIPQILASIEKKDSECLANLQLPKFVEQAQKTEISFREIGYTPI
jgi:hypothetical protein